MFSHDRFADVPKWWVLPVLQDVAADPAAIGCAGIFFAAQGVRAVPLAGSDGHFYAPTAENVRGHKYPLSRFLYVCMNKPPSRHLSGSAAEFIRFLLSSRGAGDRCCWRQHAAQCGDCGGRQAGTGLTLRLLWVHLLDPFGSAGSNTPVVM